MFSLKTIIDIYLSRKKRLYCAFVDFKKAFDTIWRVGLWSKLIHLGLSGKILTGIQNIYINAKSCVTCNNNQSDYFMSHNGERQGENFSPLLLYMGTTSSLFFSLRGSSPNNAGDDVIDVYMKIFVLLYADDTVIMANDAQSLQKNLHYLSEYCDMWNLSVNTDKTKIVIFFSKYEYREKNNFIYKNTTIEIVEHFKYPGVIFNFNNSFVKHKNTCLIKQTKPCLLC